MRVAGDGKGIKRKGSKKTILKDGKHMLYMMQGARTLMLQHMLWKWNTYISHEVGNVLESVGVMTLLACLELGRSKGSCNIG